MNDLTKPKKQRSISVIDFSFDKEEPNYSRELERIMPKYNGSKSGIDALKNSIDRNKIK